ncbi:MAG: YitT family protein [Agathobacter sp.]
MAFDIVGAFFYSIGVYTFAKMANFAPGGLTGIALMLNHLWKLPIGTTSLLLNLPLIYLSYKFVGRIFILKSIKTMLVCTIFLDLIFPFFPVYSGSRFMAALYSGIFLGIGLALFYMRGSSSGGTDFITMSIKALRPHFSIGLITITIDLFIILLGWPVFGNIDAVLYGLTSTILTSLVIDKIMYGLDSGSLILVITVHSHEIAHNIGNYIRRGSTIVQAFGSYTGQRRDILLCACSKSQTYLICRVIQEIDPGAFVMITETTNIFGEGFAGRSIQ